MIVAEEVSKLLKYDPVSGFLHWKNNRGGKATKGSRAGWLDNTGYIRIDINYKSYLAHRIIWLLQYGEFPPDQIDHINRVRHDNRMQNLRSVSRSENMMNQPLRANNTSGVCGVGWHKLTEKWEAKITVQQNRTYLGYFSDWFEAVCARKSADNKHNFHPSHGDRKKLTKTAKS